MTNLTEHDWLRVTARARPNGLALITGGQQYTYAHLHQKAEQVARWLHHHGLKAGDFAAVLMPNNAEYVFVIHALARLGAVIIPLNTRLTTEELRWQMQHTHCRFLIYNAQTQARAAALSDLSTTVSIESLPAVPTSDLTTQTHIQSDQLQSIVFTSGTSGHPKAAMLTWGNHFWSATASAFRLGVLPGDRWLCVLPLYHVGGLAIILRSALYGTAVVLHNGFDLDEIARSLHDNQITLISLVPTMLYRMLEAGIDFPPSLRLVLLGGAAAGADLIERCQRLGIPIAPTYGLSEACSQVATLSPQDAARKPGSVGRPLSFTSVRVVDESGVDVPTGGYGEVVVRGPTVFSRYFDNPDANARTLRDGDLYTGDIGYLDEDGDLWLVQRRSDLIVSGGENVYPAEIERVLKAYPGVADAAVVGLPNAEWGQIVAAAVVLKEGQTLTPDDLIAYSRQHLAGYKQPRRIEFVEALPQTASGKVQRRELVSLFEVEQ
ncbi:MAG: o-succinylbenzoate--CoA ligase [bacterium]|nr:o-succinylbenzoate--CoA ligase [bacterium]